VKYTKEFESWWRNAEMPGMVDCRDYAVIKRVAFKSWNASRIYAKKRDSAGHETTGGTDDE